MEVCGEGETAVSQGGGDAPLGHKLVSWEEQVQAEEEQKSKEGPRWGNCLCCHFEAQLPLPLPCPLWPPLLVTMGS